MFGRMDDESVRGRHYREWLDDIVSDWYGMELHSTTSVSGAGSSLHPLATDCV